MDLTNELCGIISIIIPTALALAWLIYFLVCYVIVPKQSIISGLKQWYYESWGSVSLVQYTTIKPSSNSKEYCQCEYCGTFYTKFVSGCKNCGAPIIPLNNKGE